MSQLTLLSMTLIFLLVLGCHPKTNRANLVRDSKAVNRTDGITEQEAIILAQVFLVQDLERCGADQDRLNIKTPECTSAGEHYEVHFSWLGFDKLNRLFPMIVAINKQTGSAKCLGQRVRK